jgi:hypothetical protein
VGTVNTRENGLRALLLEAFKAGQAHTAYDEGLRGAEPVLEPEEWVEAVVGGAVARQCPGHVPDEYKKPGYVGVTPEGMHCRHWQEEDDTCCRCGASRRMVDLIGVKVANVLIDEFGRRIWVCTEEGTVLRIRAKSVTLEDRRLVKE